jgi:T3SS negative regulator,GrlR
VTVRWGAAIIMIRNGLYSLNSKALDGVSGGASAVLVLRDGTLYGGDSFFYYVGTYSSSNGRWKGEMTSQEHTKAPTTRPMAGRVVNVGFSGTYTDEGAEAGATALIGKRSVRYDAILRLLVAD